MIMLELLEPDLSFMTLPFGFCSELCVILMLLDAPVGAAEALLLAIIDAAIMAAALCSPPKVRSTLVEISRFLTRVRTTRFLLPLDPSKFPIAWLNPAYD